MTSQYDAIIVGAGPAGASAAQVLADGGARVLLLEKARFPRYKPCGGGITARTRRFSPVCASYAVSCAAEHLVLQIGQQRVPCRLPASIGMSMRDSLDQYLVDQAISSGATFRDGMAVR